MPGIESVGAGLIVAIVAAILHLDRIVVFQTLFHRPVFLAPACGLISGQWELSVWVALVTEFASLLVPPTGTDLPLDESGWAAVTMTGLAFARVEHPAQAVFVLGLAALGLPVLRNMDIWIRNANGRLARQAVAQAKAGRKVPFKRLVAATAAGQTFVYGLMYSFSGALIAGAIWMLERMNPVVVESLWFPTALVVAVTPMWMTGRSQTTRSLTLWLRMLLWACGTVLATMGVTLWLD